MSARLRFRSAVSFDSIFASLLLGPGLLACVLGGGGCTDLVPARPRADAEVDTTEAGGDARGGFGGNAGAAGKSGGRGGATAAGGGGAGAGGAGAGGAGQAGGAGSGGRAGGSGTSDGDPGDPGSGGAAGGAQSQAGHEGERAGGQNGSQAGDPGGDNGGASAGTAGTAGTAGAGGLGGALAQTGGASSGGEDGGYLPDADASPGETFDASDDASAGGGASNGAGANGGSTGAAGAGGRGPGGQTNDGCTATLTAPAPVSPVRGSYSGSLWAPATRGTLRPTFQWTPARSTCSHPFAYEIALDASCVPGRFAACPFTNALTATDIPATFFTPAEDLPVATQAPVGALYAWKVRACEAGSGACSPWSDVAHLHVGRVREDLDGDGYGDVLAPARQAQTGVRETVLYRGGAAFDPATPSLRLALGVRDGHPAFLGDVNGDGFGDFGALLDGVAAPTVPVVVLGGAIVDDWRTVVLSPSATTGLVVDRVAAAGDGDGDGFADVLVQETSTGPAGGVLLHGWLGRAAVGPFVNAGVSVAQDEVSDLAHLGDLLAADGFDEVGVIGQWPVLGDVLETSQAHDSTFRLLGTLAVPGGSLSSAADATGDGYLDALVALPGRGFQLYAGPGGLGLVQVRTWAAPKVTAVRGGFDFDLDGVADFLVAQEQGEPWLFRGGPTPTRVDGALAGWAGLATFSLSDHDGDGRLDLVGGSASPSPLASDGPGALVWARGDGTPSPALRAFVSPAGGLVLTGDAFR